MAEKEEKSRPMAEQPHWHPIAMLATIARHIDGMVEADQEQLATLQEARTRPYVLDDYTVTRVKGAFTTQREDFWVFEEQLRRWQALKLTTEQRAEVTRLQPDGSPSPNQQRCARAGRGVEQRHDREAACQI